jgi:hypothetical protein
MLTIAAWFLFILGIAHVFYGIVRFRTSIREALTEGFCGKFAGADARRLAFWFTAAGPLLALAGQVALHAVTIGDMGLIRMIGLYLSGLAIVGILAFPKSPLWVLLLPVSVFIAAGYGWIAP